MPVGRQARGRGRGHNCFSILGTMPTTDRVMVSTGGPGSNLQAAQINESVETTDPDEYPLERFSQRAPIQRNHHQSSSQEPAPILRLNTAIREYVRGTTNPGLDPPFIHQPEIPSSDEISVLADGTEQEVPVNHITGAWASKQKYLSDHYALLREDGVAPLRNVVSELKERPNTLEHDSVEQSQIYEKVFIVGLTFAHGGVAAKVTFSLRRTGKKIIWEQSKRLLQGTLIALTPADDMFQTICKVAVVAARPLSGVQSNPPAIDIFFGDPNDIEIDPQQEWVMVESSRGYFEAYRHTLKSLQRIAMESFSFAEYIVNVEQDVRPPHYVEQQPFKDMSSVFQSASRNYTHVDILSGDWPTDATSNLDASQLDALRRILTKQLAIIQGPPGTGKTHVSIVALKVLLENKRHDDPPIIVAAHTNHALDQLLRHIAPIESKFIRLGGMTSDYEIIKPRTLYEIKQATKLGVVSGGARGPALAGIRTLVKEMQALLKPLTEGKPLEEDVLKAHRILTEGQCKSVLKGAEKWVDTSLPDSMTTAMHKWAGEELVEANRRTQAEDYGFDYEEIDLEYEQLKELEAEGKVGSSGDDDNELLRGERLTFSEPWTGREGRTKEDCDALLRTTNDLWQIAPESRGPLYRYMQQRLKEIITGQMRRLLAVYERRVTELKIGKWEVDTNYLKESKLIGCTLTGISKYRALLHSLQPKIVLIEEAAETLEAQTTAACFNSLEHLILVGDHQQLRGQCNEQQLQGEPWFLDVSMFERLVHNQVGFTQLSRQRRMHPEIRRGLMPIYPNLEDHPSVALRPCVPGMGPLHTYFFSHDWPEDTDDLMSKVNRTEANMVVNFFNYLIKNGAKTKDITVLTFYNGQRKLILSNLRRHANLQGEVFKVVTVDSYQGEENGIVLLSLVRSNEDKQIGFLSVRNRVCVALSRAQQGFYIFGDAGLLSRTSRLWSKVIEVMSENPRRLGLVLPLTCQNHQITTYAKDPGYFHTNSGGCEKACGGELPCGHGCVLKCHPFSHIDVLCHAPCNRKLICGHGCDELCYAPCRCPCEPAGRNPSKLQTTTMPIPSFPSNSDAYRSKKGDGSRGRSSPTKGARGSPGQTPSQSPPKEAYRFSGGHSQALMELTPEAQAFRDFADGGYVAADAAAANSAADAAAKERHRKLDADNHAALFGNDEGDLITTSLVPRTNEMRLTTSRQARDGTIRNVYEGSYRSLVAGPSGKKQQPSLLDLD